MFLRGVLPLGEGIGKFEVDQVGINVVASLYKLKLFLILMALFGIRVGGFYPPLEIEDGLMTIAAYGCAFSRERVSIS